MIWSLDGEDEWEEWLYNVGNRVFVLAGALELRLSQPLTPQYRSVRVSMVIFQAWC